MHIDNKLDHLGQTLLWIYNYISIDPLIFLLQFQVMEEGTEKEVSTKLLLQDSSVPKVLFHNVNMVVTNKKPED